MNPLGSRVGSIGQHAVSGLDRQTAQRLAVTLATTSAEPQIVAPQRGPTQTVVNTPHAAGLARFFDVGGIHQSDSAALNWLISRQVCLLKQTAAKLVEPLLAFAQSFKQGHIRKLSQMCLSRSDYRLAQ